jgi:hypothetical protein
MTNRTSLVVVVPVKGKDEALSDSLSALVAAVALSARASLVLVDNNAGTERDAILDRFADKAKITRSDAKTVGGVRNDGVRAAEPLPTYIAFVDCDCVVRESFCNDVLDAFAFSRSEIVGCRVISPIDGHWTERASDALHRQGGDGPRESLNSGCLAIRSDTFQSIGGFSEILPANEDYDLCSRVRATGGSIRQFESLQVVHLGNPKSVSGFMRRLTWHGRGAVREDGRIDFSLMLIATLSNSAATLVGSAFAVGFAIRGNVSSALLCAMASIAAVPIAFWAIRGIQMRRWINPFPSIALMQLTFLARQAGLIARLTELRRDRSAKR